VHPRQIYAFAQAASFGWNGDVAGIVRRGVDYFEKFYRRPDGLFRTLAGVDGTRLDDQAVLYDQAFALLGYAAAGTALDARDQFEPRALSLFRAAWSISRCADSSAQAAARSARRMDGIGTPQTEPRAGSSSPVISSSGRGCCFAPRIIIRARCATWHCGSSPSAKIMGSGITWPSTRCSTT
jgi:hypothetical protein